MSRLLGRGGLKTDGIGLCEHGFSTRAHRRTSARVENPCYKRPVPSLLHPLFPNSTEALRKDQMQSIQVQRQIGGRTLSSETGSYAKLADGAVTVQYGDSVVFGAVVRANP